MTDWDGKGYEEISDLQRNLAQRTLADLAFRGDEHLLDVGCGDGYITRSIAARLPRGSVVGVDASPRMIEAAMSRPDPAGTDLRFEICDVLAMPFAREFDVVVSFNVLHWLVDQRAALAAIARATKPDGRVIVQQVCAGPRPSRTGEAGAPFDTDGRVSRFWQTRPSRTGEAGAPFDTDGRVCRFWQTRPSLEQLAMQVCGRPRWSAAFADFAPPYVHVPPEEYPEIAGSAGLLVTSQAVQDIEWDFGSRAAFTRWCTVGFTDWTTRLAPESVAEWVDEVVTDYQAVVGRAGLFRFMQLRAEMTTAAQPAG